MRDCRFGQQRSTKSHRPVLPPCRHCECRSLSIIHFNIPVLRHRNPKGGRVRSGSLRVRSWEEMPGEQRE